MDKWDLGVGSICRWHLWGAVGAQRRGPNDTAGWEDFLEEVMSGRNPEAVRQVMSWGAVFEASGAGGADLLRQEKRAGE